MTTLFNKNQIETLVLQTILRRSAVDCGGCSVYQVKGDAEILALKELSGCQSVANLAELEDAVNAPAVTSVFVDANAAVTFRSLKSVLQRCVLNKTVFVAFDLKE